MRVLVEIVDVVVEVIVQHALVLFRKESYGAFLLFLHLGHILALAGDEEGVEACGRVQQRGGYFIAALCMHCSLARAMT
ncbi:hypothetical protein BA896_017860 [Janthinobacterium lividum]|uniref:Uncharacterized protein n=1 Tax=Janthinobacterium lividum TaxID=29581 RepID=A0A1E8PMH4_9BURK|nr:hypothetical protein BA896_017860 [Janthinobacterium lividum]